MPISQTDKPHPLYSRASFLSGAAHPTGLPPDRGREVAFAGRSNVGKSSAINAITGIGSLARTGKTPGRTQQINFFQLDEARRLVDLPGYGYAKAPGGMRRAWGALVENYLRERRSLQGVILLMDARHPLTVLDRQLVDWCREMGVAFCLVLTKRDKLSRGRALEARRETLRRLAEPHGDAPPVPAASPGAGDRQGAGGQEVILFSASRGDGIPDVRARLDGWLGWDADQRDPGMGGPKNRHLPGKS